MSRLPFQRMLVMCRPLYALLKNGMQLWINLSGKKNKETVTSGNEKEMPFQGSPQGWGRGQVPDILADGKEEPGLLNEVLTTHHQISSGSGTHFNCLQHIRHPARTAVSLFLKKHTLGYRAQLPVNIVSGAVVVNSRKAVAIVKKGKERIGDYGHKLRSQRRTVCLLPAPGRRAAG
jgi:hypothetical protein